MKEKGFDPTIEQRQSDSAKQEKPSAEILQTPETGIKKQRGLEAVPENDSAGVEFAVLEHRIKSLVGNSTDAAMRRYASLLQNRDSSPILTADAASELIELLRPNYSEQLSEFLETDLPTAASDVVSPRNGAQAATRIRQLTWWLGEVSGSERLGRKQKIQQALARRIHPGDAVGLPFLVLAGEMDQLREEMFNEDELTDALETNVRLDNAAVEQLRVLNRLNNPHANVLLHKILDFAQTHQTGLEKDTPEQQRRRPWRGHGVSQDFFYLSRDEAKLSQNYLVNQHWQDFLEMSSYGNMEKPGSVHGVAGGGSDAMIYTYRNIQKSYEDRLALGIQEGWPIANPVLPIAPGYYGFYKGDRLQKVFPGSQVDVSKVRRREQAYTQRNNPEDEYIYDDLNMPEDFHPGRKHHPSHDLGKLEHLWDFKKHLKVVGREFFYDLRRIDHPEKLHQIVLGELVQRNTEYIDRQEGKNNAIEPISLEQYRQLLFPQGHASKEQEYVYGFMATASMRKKVEDDFGINIEQIPFYGQVQFLNFFYSADVQTAERLQAVFKKFENKQTVAMSFLACGENPRTAESILAIAEQADSQLSAALFEKYAAIVHSSENVKEFLQHGLGVGKNFNEKTLESIVKQLFTKANDLLNTTAENLQERKDLNSQDLLRHISNYRTEVAVLASAMKHVRGVALAEIRNAKLEVKDTAEITPAEKQEMANAFEANRAKLYPGGLKDFTLDGFNKLLNESGHEFYIFEFKDHPAVFFHVDKETADTWYVGSLNLGPEAFDSPLAIAVIKAALEQEDGQHNLRAKVYEHNPARRYYTKFLGFKETGKEEVVRDETGKEFRYFELLRPKITPQSPDEERRAA